jgi:hypothetical protein
MTNTYGKTCMERHVWKDMYGKTCMERHVWKDIKNQRIKDIRSLFVFQYK